MNQDEINRQQAKTREQGFINIMEDDFNFSPKIAQAILTEAQAWLLGQQVGIKPGQIRVLLLSQQAPHGQALRKMPLQEVTWTIDAGHEDEEVKAKHGRLRLRQTRIQRLLAEAIEQGAMASQEDLARALQVDVRTIKRDCQQLMQQGSYVPTRGNLKGIGRGQTHKAQIVGRWLAGETYDQVAYHTCHSLTCVKRYIQSFIRVVQLHQKDFAPAEISLALQVGRPLVVEYLKLLEQQETPFSRQRLADQLQRLSGASDTAKRGIQ